MLNVTSFADCVRQQLKEKRYGKERADQIIEDFHKRTNARISAGESQLNASANAMRDVMDKLTIEAAEKVKRTAKMLELQAGHAKLLDKAMAVDVQLLTLKDLVGKQVGPRGSRGEALGRAAVSKIEANSVFGTANYTTDKHSLVGELMAGLNDVLDKIGKGAFATQKGKAHLPNIVREVYGEHTGDRVAADAAQAWLKTADLTVDLFNRAGGSMRKLDRYLPQIQNAAKLYRAGFDTWRDAMLKHVNWSKTLRPDGAIIPADQREAVLKEIYGTIISDGATKIDAKAFRGEGKALGNMLDQHRFLHFNDAAAWLAVHEQFGDGNVFDVLVGHVDRMAHQIALVKNFGPNPAATVANLSAMIKKRAAELSPIEKAKAEVVLKNKFEPMMEVVQRSNPMNPESLLGNTVVGASNLLVAAQLGSASLAAIPGDFMQSVAVKFANHMPGASTLGMDMYLRTMAGDPLMTKISTQTGFVLDQAIMSTYAATRFTGMATAGPAVTRRISDTTMRASLMAGHTNAARWASQAEFMGLLHRDRGVSFDKLPYRNMMERHGISAAEWDALRANAGVYAPAPGVEFLKPLDILNSSLPNRREVYEKFQGMIHEESRLMVPESTLEAAVMLKGASRPDTLRGAILHSFSMYKNFPVSFWMIYGRLAMASPSIKGRLGFVAGLGVGMTMVGALSVQMRELKEGRDLIPMNTPKFWGKALLAGGAPSIWGDFLFDGVNRFGKGPEQTVAGPITGLLGDTTQLAFGDVFKWADAMGSLDQGVESTTLSKSVEFAKRYTPGTNIWWAKKALEASIWDRVEEMADPKVYQKRMRRQQKQRKVYGNEYWWRPGSAAPDRAPEWGF